MPEQDLAGRRALITGGASGIGLACAQEFAGRGGKDPVRYGDWETKGLASDF